MSSRRERHEARKLRAKRLRADLRQHADSVLEAAREEGTATTEKLDGLLDTNDALAERVEEVYSHGMVSHSFLRIASLTREQLTKLQTGLRALDHDALVAQLFARQAEEQGGRASSGSAEGGGGESDARADDNNGASGVGGEESSAGTDHGARPSAQQALDLAAVGRRYARYFRTAPVFDCMLGPMSVPQRESRRRQQNEDGAGRQTEEQSQPRSQEQQQEQQQQRRRQRGRRAAVARPEEVTSEDAQQRTETDLQIKEMYDELARRHSLGFYDLVLDPNDFGRTIENIFHSSFLVRDGRCRLATDEASGQPRIQSVSRAETQALYAGDGGGHGAHASGQSSGGGGGDGGAQTVVRFDKHRWQALRRHAGHAEAALPSKRARPGQ